MHVQKFMGGKNTWLLILEHMNTQGKEENSIVIYSRDKLQRSSLLKPLQEEWMKKMFPMYTFKSSEKWNC